MESIKERTFTIKNKLGLHARAANMVVQSASNFACSITVTKDGIEANAKSIMGLLLLAAGARLEDRGQGRRGRMPKRPLRK